MVTIAHRADRVDTGSLDDLHFFRQKQFKNIFFCPSCIRSFESDQEEEKCKFCDGHVQKVGDTHKLVVEPVREEKKHRFYCPKCGKIFEHSRRLLACQICDTPATHFYEYQELDLRSKFLYRFYRLFGSKPRQKPQQKLKSGSAGKAPSTEPAGEPAGAIGSHEISGTRGTAPGTAEKPSGFTLPALPKLTLPKFKLRRRGEELPTK